MYDVLYNVKYLQFVFCVVLNNVVCSNALMCVYTSIRSKFSQLSLPYSVDSSEMFFSRLQWYLFIEWPAATVTLNIYNAVSVFPVSEESRGGRPERSPISPQLLRLLLYKSSALTAQKHHFRFARFPRFHYYAGKFLKPNEQKVQIQRGRTTTLSCRRDNSVNFFIPFKASIQTC